MTGVPLAELICLLFIDEPPEADLMYLKLMMVDYLNGVCQAHGENN